MPRLTFKEVVCNKEGKPVSVLERCVPGRTIELEVTVPGNLFERPRTETKTITEPTERSDSQAQEQNTTCEPFHFVDTICNQFTGKPLAVFNQCSEINITVGVIDLQTGDNVMMIMRDHQDHVYESTRDGLEAQMKLEKAEPGPDTAQSIAEMEKGLRAIDKANTANICTPLN